MNILVVSPHPDDETIGAGGTILRFLDEGHSVYWLNIAGVNNFKGLPDEVKPQRSKQVEDIKKFYQFTDCFDLNFPTIELDAIPDSIAVSRISEIIQSVQPDWLILPNPSDIHSDHRKTFDWCMSCSKVFRYPSIRKILSMEVLSETDFANPDNGFIPNMFIDITPYIEIKLNAMNIYKTELKPHPFPRNIDNIRALAMLRGATAGTQYAEAFRIIKEIF